MHKARKLSLIEQDAITLYTKFDNKSVQQISKELQAPPWYISTILFKYLNGAVKGDMLIPKDIKQPHVLPRTETSFSKTRFIQQLQETLSSDIVLKSKGK
jgi:hypothetical protein